MISSVDRLLPTPHPTIAANRMIAEIDFALFIYYYSQLADKSVTVAKSSEIKFVGQTTLKQKRIAHNPKIYLLLKV